ncbi:MAG: flagellar basal body rod protein FlgF [Oceanococcaceae bacterium]
MDRLLYVAMNGASRALAAQAATSHNIANASTPGFKAALVRSTPETLQGAGLPSRVLATAQAGGFDASGGRVRETGRSLDVALADDHWLAVQADDGSTAYTRAGDLRLNEQGQLLTQSGRPVLGEGGAIGVPPAQSLSIGADGALSIGPLGLGANTALEVDRLQVVSAAPQTMQRGLDGLFRPIEGEPAAAPGNVLLSGALEESNVSSATALVDMIAQQRQFETQIQLMKTADENAQRSNELLRMR